MRAQISRSRSVRAAFSGRPPTCMFERVSPLAGTRLMAPTGSPSTRITRLSPCRTSGTKACAMIGSALRSVNISCRLVRFFRSASSLNTPAPPLP